jgi:putative FmdB family regulatory protein
MPIYEYECGTCGARFDKLVFLTAQPKPVTCPECSNDQVSKRLSVIASTSGARAEAGGSSATCTTSA